MTQKKITAAQVDVTDISSALDINDLVPDQTGNSGKVLGTDGTDVSWVAGGGGGSPLTTKGDLYTYSTGDARLAVGTDGQVLTADSAEATGLKWATPASGTAAGSTGQVQFNTSGSFDADAGLVFDDSVPGVKVLAVGVETSTAGALVLGEGGSSGISSDGTNMLIGSAGITLNSAGVSLALTADGELSINADVGAAGQVLTSNGVGVAPTWETPSGGGGAQPISPFLLMGA